MDTPNVPDRQLHSHGVCHEADERAPFDRALRRARLSGHPLGEFVSQEGFMRASEILALAVEARGRRQWPADSAARTATRRQGGQRQSDGGAADMAWSRTAKHLSTQAS